MWTGWRESAFKKKKKNTHTLCKKINKQKTTKSNANLPKFWVKKVYFD